MTDLPGQSSHRDSYVLPISDPGVIGFWGYTIELETIPEPSSLVLASLGLAALARRARRRGCVG